MKALKKDTHFDARLLFYYSLVFVHLKIHLDNVFQNEGLFAVDVGGVQYTLFCRSPPGAEGPKKIRPERQGTEQTQTGATKGMPICPELCKT